VKRAIAWLVPYPLKGSGGHRTIFQKVVALDAAGFQNHVYLEPPPAHAHPRYSDAAGGRELVERYFGAVPAEFHFGLEADKPAAAIFATAWFTAPYLRRQRTDAIKAYFVQDFEAMFQPMGDQYLIADHTLRYGFKSITIGRWLAMKLARDYGAQAGHFDFCADLDVYRAIEGAGAQRERSVCFLYQPDKPRRCSWIGAQALAIVKRVLPEVKITLYGHDDREGVPFNFVNQGLLSIQDCNLLYNRSQVGLCLSTTNPSRIPFEMMAAGLPVVDVYGENTRYDLPSSAIALAEPSPESIAHAVIGLLEDAPRRARMSEAGQTFMKSRALSVGLDQFVAVVEKLLAGAPLAAGAFEPLHTAPPVRATGADAERYRVALDAAESEFRRQTGSFAATNGGSTNARASMPRRIVNRLRHTLRVLTTGN
jgi:hypothetical protein